MNFSAESLGSVFFWVQTGLVLACLGLAYWILGRKRDSQFRSWGAESSTREQSSGKDAPRALPGASQEEKRAREESPLLLEGIQAEGLPHEVLGISPNSPPSEIQRAYRERMKRYHPDLVGRPGSREWADAQRIAEAINRAKEQMLSAWKTKRK